MSSHLREQKHSYPEPYKEHITQPYKEHVLQLLLIFVNSTNPEHEIKKLLKTLDRSPQGSAWVAYMGLTYLSDNKKLDGILDSGEQMRQRKLVQGLTYEIIKYGSAELIKDLISFAEKREQPAIMEGIIRGIFDNTTARGVSDKHFSDYEKVYQVNVLIKTIKDKEYDRHWQGIDRSWQAQLKKLYKNNQSGKPDKPVEPSDTTFHIPLALQGFFNTPLKPSSSSSSPDDKVIIHYSRPG